jgi:type II secretory pathway pseudopilin PulG
MGRTCRRPDQRGFTLIDLLFVVGLIGVLCVIALPGFSRARGAAQASSALGTMRAINSGQLSYAITCGLGFYAPNLTTLGVKPPASAAAFLPEGLTSGPSIIRHRYTLTVKGTPIASAPASCNGLGIGEAAAAYAIIADPLDNVATSRHFATNVDGIIYQHSSSLGPSMPESGVSLTGTPIK